MWEGELPATLKVLRSVPDQGRDYRPDEKSRTAWELATHLALADVWFIQSILDRNFKFDAEGEKRQAAKFRSAKEVADFYAREIPAKLQELRALPADQLTEVVDFFGMMRQPNAAYIGLANNHSDPPSRPAVLVPAGLRLRRCPPFTVRAQTRRSTPAAS